MIFFVFKSRSVFNSDNNVKIDAAATQGATEQAEAKAASKISLLTVEGHVTYQYEELLDRIS